MTTPSENHGVQRYKRLGGAKREQRPGIRLVNQLAPLHIKENKRGEDVQHKTKTK